MMHVKTITNTKCNTRRLKTYQQDIYLPYIDFKNAFGSVDHA
jgi:hypothetical protein